MKRASRMDVGLWAQQMITCYGLFTSTYAHTAPGRQGAHVQGIIVNMLSCCPDKLDIYSQDQELHSLTAYVRASTINK